MIRICYISPLKRVQAVWVQGIISGWFLNGSSGASQSLILERLVPLIILYVLCIWNWCFNINVNGILVIRDGLGKPQVFAVPPEHLSIWCGDDIRSRFRANVINHGWFPMFTALEHHFVPLVEVWQGLNVGRNRTSADFSVRGDFLSQLGSSVFVRCPIRRWAGEPTVSLVGAFLKSNKASWKSVCSDKDFWSSFLTVWTAFSAFPFDCG